MPTSLGFMPSLQPQHRQRHDPFSPDTEEPKKAYTDSSGREALYFTLSPKAAYPDSLDRETLSFTLTPKAACADSLGCEALYFTLTPKAAYPDSLGHEGLSFHFDSSKDTVASPNHLLETQKPKDARRTCAPFVTLAKCSDMHSGADACTESEGLRAIVHAVQTQQEELAQHLDAAVLQLHEQMCVMKSEITRTQLDLAADRNQRGELEATHALLARRPSVSQARTACIKEDACQLPAECAVLEQNQHKYQADSLKHDIIDIANEVCDMFAGPLNALTESLQRAESDMESLRSALLDVQKDQAKYSHGANQMQVAMGKLDKMVCQVLDVMKIEETHSRRPAATSKWPAVTNALRAEHKIQHGQLGSSCGTPSVPRPCPRINLKVREVPPTLVSENRRTCSLIAGGNYGEDIRGKTSSFGGTMITSEQWKRVDAHNLAAAQVSVK